MNYTRLSKSGQYKPQKLVHEFPRTAAEITRKALPALPQHGSRIRPWQATAAWLPPLSLTRTAAFPSDVTGRPMLEPRRTSGRSGRYPPAEREGEPQPFCRGLQSCPRPGTTPRQSAGHGPWRQGSFCLSSSAAPCRDTGFTHIL